MGNAQSRCNKVRKSPPPVPPNRRQFEPIVIHVPTSLLNIEKTKDAEKKEKKKKLVYSRTDKGVNVVEIEITEEDERLEFGPTFSRIVAWAWEEKHWWFAAYGVMCANTVLGAMQPQLFTNIVQAVGNPASGMFLTTVVQLTSVSLLVSATSAMHSITFSEAGFRMNMKLKRLVLTNVLQQEMGFFDSTTAGDLITQVASTGGVCGVMNGMVPNVIRSILTMATTFLILSRIDVRLALVTLVSVPFEVWMSLKYSKIFEKYSETVQEVNAKTGSVIQETMQGIKAIRPLHAEERQSEKFLNQIMELRKLQIQQRKMLAGQTVLNTIVPHFTGIFLLVYAGQLVLQNQADISALITVSMYQSTLQSAMTSLMSLYQDWGRLVGSTKKVFQYMDRNPEGLTRGVFTPPCERLQGHIEIRNVKFAYPTSGNVVVLNKFNFEVTPGEIIALVGPSGGGKSTIINLIMGLYDPQEGDIFVDGRPVSEYDPAFMYTRGIAVVSQTPTLFRCSVKENLTFGLPEGSVSDEKIIEACKLANAHDFIINMAEGYDTDLGQDGGKLSGGERQRLAIARAIVRDPAILLLDEPTSALDNRCESQVKDALMNVMQGRTVIIVAHRLTTVQHLKRIIVVDEGRIVEEGDHETLLVNKGLYYTLAAGVFAEEEAKKKLKDVQEKVRLQKESETEDLESRGEVAEQASPRTMSAMEDIDEEPTASENGPAPTADNGVVDTAVEPETPINVIERKDIEEVNPVDGPIGNEVPSTADTSEEQTSFRDCDDGGEQPSRELAPISVAFIPESTGETKEEVTAAPQLQAETVVIPLIDTEEANGGHNNATPPAGTPPASFSSQSLQDRSEKSSAPFQKGGQRKGDGRGNNRRQKKNNMQ